MWAIACLGRHVHALRLCLNANRLPHQLYERPLTGAHLRAAKCCEGWDGGGAGALGRAATGPR